MRTKLLLAGAAMAAPLALAHPALAAPAPKWGDPVAVGDGFTIDPIIDARLRYEHVDQPTVDADAVTLRLRVGAEVRHAPSHLGLLAEAEATLALDDHYNAFPYVVASRQRRPQYATIADPMNVELNRLQLQYKTKQLTLTVGRQRINLDDQRWVGNAGWRQNEQTFDAARAEAKIGPVALDGTYAISQRTIYGIDGGPRRAFDGNFVFLGAGTKLGPLQVKGFAYLLDYDAQEQLGALAIPNADTQTYGVRATESFPLAPKLKLNVMASYARQSDYKNNPLHYGADYIAGEAGLAYLGWGLTGGYEKLGSALATGGVRRALQTPMATLHKFNGWADVFLTTPNNGLQDMYVSLGKKFDGVKALPGLNATVTWHRFDSDFGSTRYGDEWDASVGFKLGKVAVLAKYADYSASTFGVDTKKFWLQGEVSF
ncbi:MAG: alginate export family protein [Novosphingobium sp.]|nr:alginate export family protein [Novosphingobium sp.]